MKISDEAAAIAAAQLVVAHVQLLPPEVQYDDHNKVIRGVTKLFARYVAEVQGTAIPHLDPPLD